MANGTHQDRSRLSTLEFLVRLLRWRKLVLINTLSVAALAVVVSLLLPNWYEAWTSVLPPQEETLTLGALSGDVSSALATASQRLALTGRMSLPMWASPSDLLSGILRSRRLREAVIREHNLIDVYKCETIDEALDEFRDKAKVRVGAEGIVRLRVLDKDPERAAAIAGSCIRVLDEIRRTTRHNRAADVGGFIDERLQATRRDLAAAEESLRTFQERYGLLLPEEQAKALVETIARVEAERLLVKVERDALVEQVGTAHPEIQALDTRLRSLENAKASLEGRLGGQVTTERSAIIDLGRLPDLSLAYLRLYRDVGIQEALFGMLTQTREQYRILEVRDTPTVQVLSPAVAPEEKAKPHRSIICVVATLLALLVSLGVAVVLERMAVIAETDPERFARLQRLISGLGLGFVMRRYRTGS
jgi:uncharacterized protein involved in exopolysaccharide biosynthesis